MLSITNSFTSEKGKVYDFESWLKHNPNVTEEFYSEFISVVNKSDVDESEMIKFGDKFIEWMIEQKITWTQNITTTNNEGFEYTNTVVKNYTELINNESE